MIIKNSNSNKTGLSYFDLLGDDELALSKGFAYLISSKPQVYAEILRQFKIKNLALNSHFRKVTIVIENIRDEGRTDIEILSTDYHIIIECKVRKNKTKEQRTQYIPCFNKNVKRKMLCFITQERDSNLLVESDVIIKYLSWIDIISMLDKKKFLSDEMTLKFIQFANRSYKMNSVKEILIQDLGDDLEIERFEKYHLYRRDETYGSPLYFAPYFTRVSGKTEGVSYVSKILGILTIKPSEFELFEEELKKMSANSKNLVTLWQKGISIKKDKSDTKFTYYFLDKPYKFNSPLLKDKGNHKGVGKNWILDFPRILGHSVKLGYHRLQLK